jgi:tetratricopeptide (TPR) repeat protein
VRASDADVARETVQMLRYEVGAASEPVAAVAHEAVVAHPVDAAVHDVPPPDGAYGVGRSRWIVIVGGLVLAGLAIAAALVLTRDDPMETGIRAFEAGRMGVAEEQLERAVGNDSSNVTALLYLGRIQRTQGRLAQAGTTLAAAARRAPEDAAVQRELGYLFLDADRPESAVGRFRRAQELEPESVASWVGLVRALRAAGDPSAEEVLARAPAEARALLTRAPRLSPNEP